MWKTISKILSKNTWLRSNISRGGRGTPTRHTENSTVQEPAISNIDTSSNYTSDPKEEDWPNDDSFNIVPDFSDQMSDNLSGEYQTKEVTRAIQMVEEFAEEGESQTLTSEWLQELPRNMTPSEVDDSSPWPNSNKITNEVDDINEQGCSNVANAPKAMSLTSDTTANISQEMSYVGGMNHAKTRLLEATGTRASGKERKVRPPELPEKKEK